MRYTIKSRWGKLFATEMLCEKQGILFIEMQCMQVPFNTHMNKCGLGGGLCLKSREQREPNPLPKVWHSALPLASQVSSVGMGHAVYQGIGTTSPYSSLRLDSATSPTSSREHSTPSILRCIHPLSRV